MQEHHYYQEIIMATSDKDKGNKQGEKSGSQQSDTSKRGFASMDPEQQREIAAEGGRAAHEKGTAHEFTRKKHAAPAA
jgi:general stress protein YciG